MKLLLRRDQKAGMMGMGSIKFILDVRAELTPEEERNVKKYKLGETMLYQKMEVSGGSGLLGLASRLAYHAMNITVSVDDLQNGKQVECKDIVEMLAVEEQIKDAARTFKNVLEAAASFGGEKVVALE